MNTLAYADRIAISRAIAVLSQAQLEDAVSLMAHKDPGLFEEALAAVTAADPGRRPYEVVWEDQAARWEKLRDTYPQARYWADHGLFYGAFRDGDEALRSASLERLISRLLDREAACEGLHHPQDLRRHLR